MAFKKHGSPADTISVRKDGETSHFCKECSKMTRAEMAKAAFASGQAPSSRCGSCGAAL